MARTVISEQDIVRTGLEATYEAADQTNGMVFVNTGKQFVHILNGDASPHTLTIETPNTVDGLAVADMTVVVTNAEERFVGPFPKSIYNQTDAGQTPDLEEAVFLDLDADTSVTIAVIRLPDPSY